MRLNLSIFFTILFSCSVLCASEHLCFDHYRTQDGLCCDYVLGVGQDSNGFIWITTQDGVSRFDGFNFRNYTKDRGGLMRKNVACLTKISSGELILGGDNGMLQTYDLSTDSFLCRRFPELMEKYVKSVSGFCKLRDGRDLLLSTSGVFPYDTLKGSFAKDSLLTNITEQLFVEMFYQDRFGNYWVGTFDGLHIFSSQGEKLGSYSLSKDNAPASSIIELDSAHVLVSTNMGGVWLFDVSEKEAPACRALDIPFKNVSVMLKDKKGRIWFGTWGNGLWRMDHFGNYVEIKTFGGDDDLKKVHALFEDSDQSIWVGTQVNGLFRCQADNNSKILHSSEMGYPNVDASCFLERPDGNIYVGTDGTGAYLVTGEGKFVQPMKSFSSLGGSILSFSPWKKDTSLVSSWFGGIGMVSADGKVASIPYDTLENTVKSSKCVRFMSNGEIWVATQGDGAYVRRNDGTWEKITFKINADLTDKWIEDIEEAPDGSKWLVSPFNVWHCDSVKMRMSSLKGKEEASDPCILIDGACDEDGNLYVASICGVQLVSRETGEQKVLDFLPVASYFSVCFDKQGFLWCDGTAGIYRVNLKKQTFRRIPLSAEKYGKLFFQPRAIYESSAGNMFFGCSNGFIVLNYEDMDSFGRVEYLAWSKVMAKKDDDWSVLPFKENRIILDGDNEETRISFDLVSFSGIDIVCRYRLKGSDSTWTDLDGKREIMLSHLSPGKYELQLSVCLEGQEKDASQLCMAVTVSSVWWQTWWFAVIVVLVVLMTLYGLRIRLKRKRSSEDKVTESTVDPFLQQVMDIIEQNYKNPEFSVENLAKELGTSKSTLIRRLKPLTDFTPVELIGVYRLKKADDMLRTTNAPVKEVAFMTGFSSQYYFSRKYKEYFGYPPSQNKERE